MTRPPGLAARLALFLIRAYKALLSPWLPPACRFTPTCSVYAAQAIETWGFFHGSRLAARRLLRCHPWGGQGHDPVPLPPPPPGALPPGSA